MSVWCRQSVDGVPDEPYLVAPHYDRQTDAELLEAKAEGARGKGWAVEMTEPRAFTATKGRWAGVLCVREFWAD